MQITQDVVNFQAALNGLTPGTLEYGSFKDVSVCLTRDVPGSSRYFQAHVRFKEPGTDGPVSVFCGTYDQRLLLSDQKKNYPNFSEAVIDVVSRFNEIEDRFVRWAMHAASTPSQD